MPPVTVSVLRHLRTPVAAAVLAGCLLPTGVPAQPVPVADAAGDARHYQIGAGPLARVLNDFGHASGTLITYESSLTSGLHSAGLQGRYTMAQAWAVLLSGTGLEALPGAAGSHTLRRLPALPAGRASQAADGGETLDPSLPLVEVRALSEQVAEKDLPYRLAGSRSVITRDDIERFRGTSVGDVFLGAPGVLVGENRNSGGVDINIRGMQGQGRVPVLVDGARQETTVYRGYAGVASRSYIDPDLIGGIQIDKGPTLSAQGTGATGGLVSARTLNAEDIVRPGQTFGLRLRGQAIGNNSGSAVAPGTPAGLFTGNFSGAEAVYRTNCVNAAVCASPYAVPEQWGYPDGMNRPGTFQPKSWAGSLAVARRLEAIDLVAAFAQRQQGNYHAGTHGPSAWVDLSNRHKLPFYTEVRPVIQGASRFQAGERIPGTNYESQSVLLKGLVYLPRDQELELSYLRYSSAYSELMPSQLTRFANIIPVSQPRNSEVAADTYTGRYRWNPEDRPLIDLRANLWHTRTRATNNNPDESNTTEFTYNNERETYQRTGFNLDNTASLAHGAWGESQLRYGFALQTEDVRSVALSANNNNSGRNGDRSETSLFAAWQYKPVRSITLDAGLRHTRFRSNDSRPITLYEKVTSPDQVVKCLDADGDGQCDTIPNHNQQSGTAPVVSLAWEPGQSGLQFYARYAEAHRMPSLFESTTGFSFQSKSDVILKPEHATNREVGVNFLKDGVLRPSDKLRLKFALFRNHTQDYLTRTSANLWESGASEGSNWFDFTMRNLDSVRFHGAELSGSYDLGWLFTEFGATKYNKIEVCHAGSFRVNECNNYGVANSYINNMIPPRWHGNLTLGTRLLERKLTLGLRGTFMGQRTPVPQYNNDTANGLLAVVPWHAYRIFDLFASYKLSDRVSIDFNVDNFTDRYYLDALGLGLVPAPGRTARLAVTLQF